MAILDLQGMESVELSHNSKASSASGHSCPSNLSVALCDGTSSLSAVLCGHDH
jgi:hypothetical protein